MQEQTDFPTTAELVDQLFKTHLHPAGREFTYQEVATTLKGEIDPALLGKLRSGKVKNPTKNTLKLLCLFFKVPASYFFPELSPERPDSSPTPPERQLRMTLRSLGLRPETQAHLQAIIESLRSQESTPLRSAADEHDERVGEDTDELPA